MTSITPPIIFLDFDGVIRLEDEFREGPLKLVADLAEAFQAKVVITSDWRLQLDREEITALLGIILPDAAKLLHTDWGTPDLGRDQRWREIRAWRYKWGPSGPFLILDDQAKLFEGADEETRMRTVICSDRHGFVDALWPRACAILHAQPVTTVVA